MMERRFHPAALPARSIALLMVLLFPAELPADEPLTAPEPATVEQVRKDVVELAKGARSSVVVITLSGRDGQRAGLGTGFVVSADGLIATNLHVIGEARPIGIHTADGRELPVTAIHAFDRSLDLALVRVDAKDLTPLPLGDSARIPDGHPVVVLGNPHGLKYSVVAGVVSGQREIDGRKMLQLAMPIEPGNSGGPVLDAEGRVIGLVTMKSLVTDNLGFAVGIHELKSLLERPNTVPMSRWLTIGALDPRQWTTLFGSRWQQRAGRIHVREAGQGFGGRSLCLWNKEMPKLPLEVAVSVRLEDESGAAGLVFSSDGGDRHYGFYPSSGRLRLSRFDGPDVTSWNVLREISSEHYRPGQWNEFKVRLEEKKILCFVNGAQVIESTDDAIRSGRVGLAKFRHTVAEFKRFRVGAEVPSTQLAPDVAARIVALVDKLPPAESLRPDQLMPLAGEAPASVAVLRSRAEQWIKQAEQLRRLAEDVHVQSIASELAAATSGPDDNIDLARAALLIARLDNDEVEIEPYLVELDRMAEEISSALPEGADDQARHAALNKYLFTDGGFHGSRTDYYHRANSHLNRVIDDREGLPITLAVLYMELGQRLNLRIEGVGLPGHFVVRFVPAKGEPRLLDVFEGGVVLSREDAAKKVADISGQTLRDEFLKPASNRAIIQRLLHNLLAVSQNQDDREAMLRYVEAMVAIDPKAIGERGMRAVLRYNTGRREAALADLDWFLDNEPDGVDLDRLREMRASWAGERR